MPKDKDNNFEPPRDMWEVNASLNFDLPLDEDDPRYVDTEKGRGEFSFNDLYKALGVDINRKELRAPREKSYNLFCGHRGCGKSTELRRLSKYLHQNNLFFVVFFDSLTELDVNNLYYPDLLLALAKSLLEKLKNSGIEIDNVFLKNLSQWFSEKILKSEKLKDFSMEVTAGADIKAGIPFLAKLSAALTNKIKTGATYKEEIREVVKNSFSEFAFGFNQLIGAAESAIKKREKVKKLIFIIDGTDRLGDEDSKRFFIKDVYQLQQIEANFIYCAPIHLLYEGNQVQQWFNRFVLPMIKIYPAKNLRAKYKDGYEVLRQIIYMRANKKLFESAVIVDLLIENSGGNPRDLLRLLQYALQKSDMERFKKTDADKAVHSLAMDYRRFLNMDDYEILNQIDRGEIVDGNSDQIRRLLYNLAILEYNSGWWRSHPVIRRLEGYSKVANAAGNQ